MSAEANEHYRHAIRQRHVQGAFWEYGQAARVQLAPAIPHIGMALPMEAIRARLQATPDLPSWAAYLPQHFAKLSPQDSGAGPHRPAPRPRAAAPASHSGSRNAPALMASAGQAPIDNAGSRIPATKQGAVAGSRGGASSGEGRQVAVEAPAQKQSTKPLPMDATPASVIGNVLALARDAQGCRVVQKALDMARGDDVRTAIASELKTHIWEALRCPYGNHVLQKLIVSLRPEAAQFIIDELTSTESGGISQAARHRYGCRIVECLIEHCPPSQVLELVEKLVTDAPALSGHPYGNYVIQHLLEHGQGDQKRRLVESLRDNIQAARSGCYLRAVISKALTHGDREDQVALVRTLLEEPGLLATMARTRHGHVAAKFILLYMGGPEQAEARQQIMQDAEVIRASRYGRFVVACLEATEGSAT